MVSWESVWISDVTPELGFFLITEMEKASRENKRKWIFFFLLKLLKSMGKIKRNQSCQKLNWTYLKSQVELPDLYRTWFCQMILISLILMPETVCISAFTWNIPLMKITALWTRFHQMSFLKMKELEAKYLEKFNNWRAHGPSVHDRMTELFWFRGKTQQNSGC